MVFSCDFASNLIIFNEVLMPKFLFVTTFIRTKWFVMRLYVSHRKTLRQKLFGGFDKMSSCIMENEL